LILAGVIAGLLWPERKGKINRDGQDNRIKEDQTNKSKRRKR